ncbi:conserved Plasmodium protein, unknown function [Plasmodium berghei]|uniref:Uncharacterized protein n=2 Tax=Plasmodium berghei TaxID=5821 RepID=A0A509AGN3_PLABA|nr:conserved Plasmodium protein, unknown function [Plasmodium berghei ANKA]CXH87973.1 conserved Plasmodium protein, unknown function [Plasmodium berghei]SCL90143.1 conserved Plasmodium protein, unknown function [Plasmodium berghei]SCM15229.1 conserved Plasmodium protein, unknown function [Plasmodium berghei]SCM17024.1 conserved Plasmodium protein, unknown function [Plasmodium berghei]SCN21881.1 conserved Plasmodium protein, unknown function [Plasmodium berghei]|eukprot:XP_034419805.1 conserved Plasmodium protein, unknown function [Plasmodium berghei ANKA]
MKGFWKHIFCFLLIFGIVYTKEDIGIKKKTSNFRNKFKQKNKINNLNNETPKNFLQLKSAHIYNPSLAYRDFFTNNAMGTSTIYYSRLMWGGVIFLVMFLLVSSIGIYLYVDNLENSYSKNRHRNNPVNYYNVNPIVPYP